MNSWPHRRCSLPPRRTNAVPVGAEVFKTASGLLSGGCTFGGTGAVREVRVLNYAMRVDIHKVLLVQFSTDST